MMFNHDSEVETDRTELGAVEDAENKQHPEELQMNQEASETNISDKTVIAVGGAKGGVGKSALAANLAVGLALLGQRSGAGGSRPGGCRCASLSGGQVAPQDMERFSG